MSSVAKQGQSFLDKTAQLTGGYENALEMAILNGKSITDFLSIGDEIKSTTITNKRVALFFRANGEPATMVTKRQITEIDELGIGLMKIEDTFIVR